MSKNHIPAPWTHHAGSGDIYKDGYLIASVRLNSHSIEPEERATAQRIVECVNALEEIENPSQMVEDFNSMKALLKEMLMIWDRGEAISANCVYPNAVRFALGQEPKAPERKKVDNETPNYSGKMMQEEIDHLLHQKRLGNLIDLLGFETPNKKRIISVITIQIGQSKKN